MWGSWGTHSFLLRSHFRSSRFWFDAVVCCCFWFVALFPFAMDAQQQTAALLRRVAAAEGARDRARAEASSWSKQLVAEKAAHAATKAAAAEAAEAAAAAAEAAAAAHRSKLLASHMREIDVDIAHDVKLAQLRRGHAEELAAAVGAAVAAERRRLQVALRPGFELLEETGRSLRRRLEAVQDEVADERAFVWDRLAALPPAVREQFLS